MPAPKGNEYYKLRTKDGKDKIFKSAAALMKACNEYFEWCLANPFKEEHIINKPWIEWIEYESVDDAGQVETKQRKVTHPYFIAKTSKMRPFTLEGLCNFIEISVEGLKGYAKREDYVGVYTRVRQIIDNQQFEGAAAGFLNPSIIARKQGLGDTMRHQGDVDNPVVITNDDPAKDAAREKRIAFLISKAIGKENEEKKKQ